MSKGLFFFFLEMADRGFAFVSANDPLGSGRPGRACLPGGFEGRFGDSSHPGVVAQNQQNFVCRIPYLPAFIRADPSLWFAQIELIFESSGIFSQRLRAGAVIAALEPDAVQTVGDLLTNNHHIENLYVEIKNRIIENFSPSPEAELRTVLRGEVIADGRPSLILSRIRHLGRGRCSDEVLKTIFLVHLPANCRAVLAVAERNDLGRLATMADRIVFYRPSKANVSAISTNSDILCKLEELTSRFNAFSNRSRNPSKSHHRDCSRSRSKSNSRGGNQSFCRLHRKYGKKAHRCYKPCTFKKDNKNSENGVDSDGSTSGN